MAVFSQISWQGGIANDEYLADTTQFSDCEDVNIYESSAYFKLGPAVTTTNLTDGQNYCCAFGGKNASGTPIIYIGGTYSGGTEGILAESTDPATYNTTAGAKGRIINGGVVKQPAGTTTGTGFIVTTYGGLYTWSYDASVAIGNFTNAGLTNRKANASNTTNYAPVVIIGDLLYYAYKNEVRCFDTTTWTERFASGSGSAAIISVDTGYEITNMQYIGNSINFYANNGTDTKKYFWDGTSSEPSEVLTYKGKRVDNVVNFGNYEMALYKTKNQYSVGYVEGYDMKPVYSSDLPSNTSTRGFQRYNSVSLGATTLGDNMLAFVSGTTTTSNNALYTLGNFKPGKPSALSKQAISADTVNLIVGDGYINDIYSNFSSTLGQKASQSSSAYNSNGFIITQPIKGKALSIQKNAKKIMYGYEMQTGSTIKIYYQFDKNSNETIGATWTLLDTITVGTDFPAGNGDRAIKIDGKFHQARFKIQLETSNTSYSPKVFDFNFEYDETSTEL